MDPRLLILIAGVAACAALGSRAPRPTRRFADVKELVVGAIHLDARGLAIGRSLHAGVERDGRPFVRAGDARLEAHAVELHARGKLRVALGLGCEVKGGLCVGR